MSQTPKKSPRSYCYATVSLDEKSGEVMDDSRIIGGAVVIYVLFKDKTRFCTRWIL